MLAAAMKRQANSARRRSSLAMVCRCARRTRKENTAVAPELAEPDEDGERSTTTDGTNSQRGSLPVHPRAFQPPHQHPRRTSLGGCAKAAKFHARVRNSITNATRKELRNESKKDLQVNYLNFRELCTEQTKPPPPVRFRRFWSLPVATRLWTWLFTKSTLLYTYDVLARTQIADSDRPKVWYVRIPSGQWRPYWHQLLIVLSSYQVCSRACDAWIRSQRSPLRGPRSRCARWRRCRWCSSRTKSPSATASRTTGPPSSSTSPSPAMC